MQLHYPQIARTIQHSSHHFSQKRKNNSLSDIDDFRSTYKPKPSSLSTTRTNSFNPYTQIQLWKENCLALINKPKAPRSLERSLEQRRAMNNTKTISLLGYLDSGEQMSPLALQRQRSHKKRVEQYKKSETSLQMHPKPGLGSTNSLFYQTNMAGSTGVQEVSAADNLELQACQLPILNRRDERRQTMRINQQMRKHDRSVQMKSKKDKVPSHWIAKIQRKWVSKNVSKDSIDPPRPEKSVSPPPMKEPKSKVLQPKPKPERAEPRQKLRTPFDLSDLKPWAIEKDFKEYFIF